MEVSIALFYATILYMIYKLFQYIWSIPTISGLNSRYILVTGCDTGFGNAVAKRLDGMGCHVIAGCLTEAGETNLRKSCSDRLKTIHLDITKTSSIQNAFQFVSDILPNQSGLWGVLNNAGVSAQDGPEDWRPMEDYYKVTSVNLFGLIEVSKTFLPLIKKAKGRVVNTASLAGRFAGIEASYCVSKYGVEAFSDCLRREMRAFNVSVHLIEPGIHRTMINRIDDSRVKTMRKIYDALPREIQDQYGETYLSNLGGYYKDVFTSIYASKDITPVIDAYVHALTSKYPRARYVVGMDTMIWLTIQMLPEWLADWTIEQLKRTRPYNPVPAVCQRM